ncbi:hypothetical protein [Edaphocola aurantiacus]|uniref:hypothetical protein n=1 Tax=Edaphocola aurantiacus TaxID=2601682 RepID=UPI001C94B78E|nr:hypothetical protein [Edaphocola aurantiacus]
MSKSNLPKKDEKVIEKIPVGDKLPEKFRREPLIFNKICTHIVHSNMIIDLLGLDFKY